MKVKDKLVVLVHPAIPYKNIGHPPLGILTIAAPLVANGYNVSILDEQVEPNFDNSLIAILKKGPICVGISSMSGAHMVHALDICKIIKDNSDVPVVVGGYHATIYPKSTIEDPNIDVIVMNDGEESFLKLVNALENSQELDSIKGIAFKSNGKISYNEASEPFDIEKIPELPFYLMKLDDYKPEFFHHWIKDGKALPYETSRGCAYSCIFCSESLRKKKWRELSPERVISDLKKYKEKYGTSNFIFIDDNFFNNPKRSERIFDLMINEKLKINWYANVRPDFLNRASRHFLNKMEASGCKMLTFGAESGSERILGLIEKKARVNDVIEINRKLRNTSITPHFSTIRGFPTETVSEISKTYALSFRLAADNKHAMCDSSHLTPLPGTKIAEMCFGKEIENFTSRDWSKFFYMDYKPEKPAWLLDETHRFIKRNHPCKLLLETAGRHNLKGRDSIALQLWMRLIAISFDYGMSEHLLNLIPSGLLRKLGLLDQFRNRTNHQNN